jgi:hypothetical protein
LKEHISKYSNNDDTISFVRYILKKSLKWRKENGIDDLINNGEMKSWMVQKFPASLDAIDKEGRPGKE